MLTPSPGCGWWRRWCGSYAGAAGARRDGTAISPTIASSGDSSRLSSIQPRNDRPFCDAIQPQKIDMTSQRMTMNSTCALLLI